MADNYRVKRLYQTEQSLQENHGTERITAKGTPKGHKYSSTDSEIPPVESRNLTITGTELLKTQNQFYTSTGNIILQVTKEKITKSFPSRFFLFPVEVRANLGRLWPTSGQRSATVSRAHQAVTYI